MATSKCLRISATGFPGTTKTWRFLQEAFSEPLNALAQLTGNKVIIAGCELLEGEITSGFIAYEGIIYPFQGGVPQTSITMIQEIEDVAYDVDIDENEEFDMLPGFELNYFKFGSEGNISFPFADLKRIKTIEELSSWELPAYLREPEYIAFTQILLDKLNGIEAGAQKNVQTDWNASNPDSAAYLKNKPNVLVAAAERFWIPGDLPGSGGATTTISIPNMGDANYSVLVALETTGSVEADSIANASIQYNVYAKTATTFKIRLREWTSGSQANLRVKMTILKPL